MGTLPCLVEGARLSRRAPGTRSRERFVAVKCQGSAPRAPDRRGRGSSAFPMARHVPTPPSFVPREVSVPPLASRARGRILLPFPGKPSASLSLGFAPIDAPASLNTSQGSMDKAGNGRRPGTWIIPLAGLTLTLPVPCCSPGSRALPPSRAQHRGLGSPLSPGLRLHLPLLRLQRAPRAPEKTPKSAETGPGGGTGVISLNGGTPLLLPDAFPNPLPDPFPDALPDPFPAPFPDPLADALADPHGPLPESNLIIKRQFDT